MSKIKLLVEIDEEDYGDFCDWFESVPSSVDGLPCVKGKFNTALYDAKPYSPSGDCINRSALKEAIDKDAEDICGIEDVIDYIDNAPTVSLPDFKEGYKQAIIDGKTNFSRLQGEWIEKQETPASVSYYCSVCKVEGIPITPFCPWCGAYMKGGAE